MKCPHCLVEIYFESELNCAYPDEKMGSENSWYGIGLVSGVCPSCKNLIVYYVEGSFEYTVEGEDDIREPYAVYDLIYPCYGSFRKLPCEVPSEYRIDFDEASKVLSISPKSSAALSRRCLQNFLHNHLKIKKHSLAVEIKTFIETQKLPTYLLEAVDAIRNIGNFAAHPLKDTNTGEIIEVENGEAEWTLEVLELLFDFYFVQPERLKNRKDELNDKLVKLGKPKML